MNYPNHWSPKMLMDWLNSQSVHAPDSLTRDKINELASLLQLHRPVGSNGKHGDLHTPTCGCADRINSDLRQGQCRICGNVLSPIPVDIVLTAEGTFHASCFENPNLAGGES